MADEPEELARRRAAAEARRTDWERWSDHDKVAVPAWEARAKLTAELIPRGARVLDVGCGAMALERFLPEHCAYLPADLVARDARTLVCDLNAGAFPPTCDSDVIVALGVLEYIDDAAAVLNWLHASGKPVVFSYNLAGEAGTERRANGWVNDYTRAELANLIRSAGFRQAKSFELGQGQILVQADPSAPASRPEKLVWAVSYYTAGNFGDRLGVQLLSHVLPPNAVVQHISHEFVDRPPPGDPDLIVLGLGNSLYHKVITDDLLRLLDRAPRRIGIFGTQYRDALPQSLIDPVLDRLDTWYARSREDALIYGRGRDNVQHLGDWLISAFPMARPASDDLLEIRPSDVTGTSLDRVIARIQLHKRVTSGRLHPLLCALTSAEEVAYAEQDEMDAGASGKFRSLLMDIFGREMPPNRLWKVDRGAVVTYKARVQQGVERLRDDLARLLDAAD